MCGPCYCMLHGYWSQSDVILFRVTFYNFYNGTIAMMPTLLRASQTILCYASMYVNYRFSAFHFLNVYVTQDAVPWLVELLRKSAWVTPAYDIVSIQRFHWSSYDFTNLRATLFSAQLGTGHCRSTGMQWGRHVWLIMWRCTVHADRCALQRCSYSGVEG